MDDRPDIASQAGDLDRLIARADALVARPEFDGLIVSLDVYYRDRARTSAMDALYAGLVPTNGLAFDIGSHVGDRIGAFRRLGARVIAAEPQPDCADAIRALYGDDPGVTIVQAACGAEAGAMTMHINSANPTVSTLAEPFIEASQGSENWTGQSWDQTLNVDVTTLDALIAEHGCPDFLKVDVEGFEADVLAGLTTRPPLVSFEFTTIQKDVALAALGRLADLGATEFNLALGEGHVFELTDWVSAQRMTEIVTALPDAANSGDIYAR